MAKAHSVLRSKDFLSGLLFVLLGLGTFALSRDYSPGTAKNMGPGYFPTILACLIAALGAILMVKGAIKPGEQAGSLAWAKVGLISLAVVVFGLALRPIGLAVSVFLLVVLSALASKKFKLLPTLLLASALAISCSLIFVALLGVQVPVFGPWLGGR